MDTTSLHQKLIGISNVISNKFGLSPSFSHLIVKSAKMALRAVTLKEYKDGHIEEMIRVLRSATKLSNDEIIQELTYEFAWALTQKTIIPVLQADAISKSFYPIMLQEIADALYVHNIDALLEYLEIERSVSNKTAQKRQEAMESAKRGFMDEFDKMKMVS
ncbi:MAG TPA: hypothetical protein VL947_00250 [Cytophagales bacterium]|nr:hypothetical protein [Cytophagales bacterium]